ncbi:DUF6366 family protein [Sutcliffiella halmapala]|uniref:DUF6366 family protein n=1 Tax=Sutcliffiella halmapala TaxID=79882 RepID=UPI0009950B9D|nr:DUF6366 family protein [Sutcliffiella halmapala]
MKKHIHDKANEKEYKKNPMANFADSTNRSTVGDLNGIARSGCLTKMIILGLLFIIGLFLSYCSYQ